MWKLAESAICSVFVLLQWLMKEKAGQSKVRVFWVLKADVITNFKSPYNHIPSYTFRQTFCVLLRGPLKSWEVCSSNLRKQTLHLCKNSPLGIVGVSSQPRQPAWCDVHLPPVSTPRLIQGRLENKQENYRNIIRRGPLVP